MSGSGEKPDQETQEAIDGLLARARTKKSKQQATPAPQMRAWLVSYRWLHVTYGMPQNDPDDTPTIGDQAIVLAKDEEEMREWVLKNLTPTKCKAMPEEYTATEIMLGNLPYGRELKR